MYTKNFANLVSDLKREARKHFIYESSGHGIHHLERTFNLGMRIQKVEGGDKIVIASALLLHDFHRLYQKKGGKLQHPKKSLPVVEKILRKLSLPEDKIKLILYCVKHHRTGSLPKLEIKKCIELAIVQDADKLDMLGAIGVARAFAFSGVHGYPLWDPKIPFDGKSFNDSKRDPSEVHHFHSHILGLFNHINTKTAKAIGKKRHSTTKKFLAEFFKEWSGKA